MFSKLQQQERLAIQSLTHIREKHANAGLLRILQQSLQGHHRRVDGQKQIVVDAFNRINDCKKELLEKTKEKKILKKLKEIEHQKHKEKSKKIEQKFTDETANIKAFKSRTESKL